MLLGCVDERADLGAARDVRADEQPLRTGRFHRRRRLLAALLVDVGEQPPPRRPASPSPRPWPGRCRWRPRSPGRSSRRASVAPVRTSARKRRREWTLAGRATNGPPMTGRRRRRWPGRRRRRRRRRSAHRCLAMRSWNSGARIDTTTAPGSTSSGELAPADRTADDGDAPPLALTGDGAEPGPVGTGPQRGVHGEREHLAEDDVVELARIAAGEERGGRRAGRQSTAPARSG